MSTIHAWGEKEKQTWLESNHIGLCANGSSCHLNTLFNIISPRSCVLNILSLANTEAQRTEKYNCRIVPPVVSHFSAPKSMYEVWFREKKINTTHRNKKHWLRKKYVNVLPYSSSDLLWIVKPKNKHDAVWIDLKQKTPWTRWVTARTLNTGCIDVGIRICWARCLTKRAHRVHGRHPLPEIWRRRHIWPALTLFRLRPVERLIYLTSKHNKLSPCIMVNFISIYFP